MNGEVPQYHSNAGIGSAREPEVIGGTTRLEKQAAQLLAQADMLEKKLVHVMRVSPPLAGAEQANKNPESNVPLAARLQSLYRDLEKLNRQLSSIIERLEV